MPAFTNQAKLSYDSRTALSNIANGNISDPFVLTKTAVNDDYIFGDDVTYVLTITNSSASALTNVTVTDDLGAYSYGPIPITVYPLTYVGPILYSINGTPQAPIVPVSSTPTLAFVVPSVPAGGNATLIYEVDVNQYAPLDVGDSIVNTAAIPSLSGITAEEEIFTEDIPLLSICKSISPDPVIDNQPATFTFIVNNYGNTASTDVVFTDTFNPILTGVVVKVDGVTQTLGVDYTYNAGTGVLTTVTGHLTVPEATYAQDSSGIVTTTPGYITIVVTGIV